MDKHPLDAVVVAYFRLIDRLLNTIFASFGLPPMPISKLLGVHVEEDIDARLAKIEVARTNLVDALAAVDELQKSAQENRRELEAIVQRLKDAEDDRLSKEEELESLKRLVALQADTVKNVFGIPTRREKLATAVGSFILGSITTIVLSAAWDFLIKPLLVPFFGSLA